MSAKAKRDEELCASAGGGAIAEGADTPAETPLPVSTADEPPRAQARAQARDERATADADAEDEDEDDDDEDDEDDDEDEDESGGQASARAAERGKGGCDCDCDWDWDWDWDWEWRCALMRSDSTVAKFESRNNSRNRSSSMSKEAVRTTMPCRAVPCSAVKRTGRTPHEGERAHTNIVEDEWSKTTTSDVHRKQEGKQGDTADGSSVLNSSSAYRDGAERQDRSNRPCPRPRRCQWPGTGTGTRTGGRRLSPQRGRWARPRRGRRAAGSGGSGGNGGSGGGADGGGGKEQRTAGVCARGRQ